MSLLSQRSRDELVALRRELEGEISVLRSRNLCLNMTRGKPAAEQLDLSSALLALPGNGDFFTEDGGDARNYYGSVQGLPEARALFSSMMGAPAEQILIGNNSSLALMHDCIVFALLKGVVDGVGGWERQAPIKFLCPVPGYDRHFAICEEFSIKMVPVSLTGEGPDMELVEQLVLDPAVKGMWCVPRYSNPTGETYSREVVQRLSRMRSGAPDFRLFWDNAYGVHHLADAPDALANILDLCTEAGNPNRAFVFASTSKMTFAGAGLALFASSPENVRWLCQRYAKRTIGPDKLNQLRHVRFLKDPRGIARLMHAHREILAPKFAAIDEVFAQRLSGSGVARWTRPRGGYFISVDVLDGCARRVVEIAASIGLALVPAGAAFPYGRDPHDRHLRIAPSFPSLPEVRQAAEAITICIKLAATESLLDAGKRVA